MGTVFKKTATKPLPQGAKIIVRKGQRFAEWKPAKGKTRTAPLTVGQDGSDRIVITTATYTAKYRDGNGRVREVATGCRDEGAARSLLTEMERRAERVKGKLLTNDEANAIDHQGKPLVEHIAAYLTHQNAKGLNRARINNSESRLKRLAANCEFRTLPDLAAVKFERWLSEQKATGMGAGTRNEYRQELVGFGNWCVRTHRLTGNPFAAVPKADAKADVRRKRRALTESELRRLLDVARRRPLSDALTIRRGKRKGETVANLKTEIVSRLERLGWERALIYKTLVLTGLRKGELASLTVGQVVLDADMPHLVLNAADEKNREGSTIPLRSDLATDLREWLADKLHTVRHATRASHVIPFEPAADQPPTRFSNAVLFDVPTGLLRILDRDLVAAGIARMIETNGKPKIDKRDERGRTVDLHALRHTFGTMLSKGGVAPRTAQAAMRHSTIDLTMNTYTDPKLLDVAGAMDSLPNFPLGAEAGQSCDGRNAVKVTGTDDFATSPFAPAFAPTTVQMRISGSIPDKVADSPKLDLRGNAFDGSAYPVKRNNPLTTGVNGLHLVERKGVEPSTSALRTQRSPN